MYIVNNPAKFDIPLYFHIFLPGVLTNKNIKIISTQIRGTMCFFREQIDICDTKGCPSKNVPFMNLIFVITQLLGIQSCKYMPTPLISLNCGGLAYTFARLYAQKLSYYNSARAVGGPRSPSVHA